MYNKMLAKCSRLLYYHPRHLYGLIDFFFFCRGYLKFAYFKHIFRPLSFVLLDPNVLTLQLNAKREDFLCYWEYVEVISSTLKMVLFVCHFL